MSTTIVFPASEPSLRVVRPSAEKWAATLAEERRRLLEDQEALREREQNLRNYESRLRALQDEIESGRGSAVVSTYGSNPPVAASAAVRSSVDDRAALQAGWEKLHRARELFEAEQAHLRDDRHAIREMDAALKSREAAVAEREARVAEREARLEVAENVPGEPIAGEHTMSAVTRLTRVPFDMARSVFGGKK